MKRRLARPPVTTPRHLAATLSLKHLPSEGFLREFSRKNLHHTSECSSTLPRTPAPPLATLKTQAVKIKRLADSKKLSQKQLSKNSELLLALEQQVRQRSQEAHALNAELEQFESAFRGLHKCLSSSARADTLPQHLRTLQSLVTSDSQPSSMPSGLTPQSGLHSSSQSGPQSVLQLGPHSIPQSVPHSMTNSVPPSGFEQRTTLTFSNSVTKKHSTRFVSLKHRMNNPQNALRNNDSSRSLNLKNKLVAEPKPLDEQLNHLKLKLTFILREKRYA